MQAAEFNAYTKTIEILNPKNNRNGAFTSLEVVSSLLDKYSRDENLYLYLAHFGKLALLEERAMEGNVKEVSNGEVIKLIKSALRVNQLIKVSVARLSDKNRYFNAIFNDNKLKIINGQGEYNYNKSQPAPVFREDAKRLSNQIQLSLAAPTAKRL